SVARNVNRVPHFAQRFGEVVARNFVIFNNQNMHGSLSYRRWTHVCSLDPCMFVGPVYAGAIDWGMAETIPTTCDVLVIGGGPGGSTAAALLAEKGYRVVLIEKARHPRF